MTSVLIFAGFCLGLVAVAFIVSKITGAKAHYIDDWRPDEGEQILFEDREADTFIVPRHDARFVTYSRPRRGFVIVTNKRILAGTRPLFVKKKMLQYMMHVGTAPGEDAKSLHGGLLTRGYQTFVLTPGAMEKVVKDRKSYVLLEPSAAEPSSTNIAAIRIYTDEAARFPLPG